MKKDRLHSIKKTGFKTPNDYFTQVEERILNDVILKDKVNDSGFEVPQNYFETIESKIMNAVLTKNNPKVIPLFGWKKLMYASTVAAALVLIFNLVFSTAEKPSFEDIEMASIEYYLESGDYSGNDLAALLTEEELNSLIVLDSEISVDSIEDYLFDHATIEELTLE